MKDKIELEKTVQKYRDEVTDILDPNKIRSRIINNNSIMASSFLNDQSKFFKDNRQSTLIEAPTKQLEYEFKVNPRRPLNKLADNNPTNNNNANSATDNKSWHLKLSKWLPYIFAIIFIMVGIFYLKLRAFDTNFLGLSTQTKSNSKR